MLHPIGRLKVTGEGRGSNEGREIEMVCAMTFLYYKLFLYVAFLPNLALLMTLGSNS